MVPRPALTCLVLLSLLVLTACSRPKSVVSAPPPVAVDSTVYPASFSDANPYDWTGRRPEHYPVHGIDLSRWQTSVDWATARRSGVNFAFIKATEGGDRVDPLFATHWRAAAMAGVPRGAYHFYYFCTSAEVQARWFIANVPRERGALPPVLDMEWNPQSPTCSLRPDPAIVRSEMRTFLDLVGQHFGQRPVIYTTRQFWEDNALVQMPGEEIWMRSTAGHPEETWGATPWSFWQYSGTGLVPGIAGRVDVNAFAGDAATWSRWRALRSQ